jgi:5-formyltetrahydrofolate cyclo-ligase
MHSPERFPNKALLRTSMRTRLREERGDSAALRAEISSWLGAHPEVRTIATFAALVGEPDLLPLVAAHAERNWLFPAVRDETLTFHAIRNPYTELGVGAFGIREPALGAPEVDGSVIDAFLCPGLAFTRAGGRLGRGRGFYDRALALARPDAVKIGVCFPFQLVEDTFSEPHDIPMDEVIC